MNKQEEVKFTQSGFLNIDGKKRVSVRFERGSDIAEGMLPPGKITKNHGCLLYTSPSPRDRG